MLYVQLLITCDVNAAIKNIGSVATPSGIHLCSFGPFGASWIVAPRLTAVFARFPVLSPNNVKIAVQLECFEMHQISQLTKSHDVTFREKSIIHPWIDHEVKYLRTSYTFVEHKDKIESFHV